jgi:hypothetical protein
MSRRMNHARVNMQKRINQEYQHERYERPFYQWESTHRVKVRGWIVWRGGKHEGESMPEILVKDPTFVTEYLYVQGNGFKCLLQDHATSFQLRVAHQLQVLANRSQNIRVPAEKRETHEFAILVDSKGVFRRVALIRKGAKPTPSKLKNCRVAMRSSVLDFSVPYHFENSYLGLQRMSKCFRKLFFQDSSGEPSTEDILAFFMDRTNFDLSHCASHKSLMETDADTNALRNLYRQSLIRH